MAMFRDDPSRVVPVQWYFVDPTKNAIDFPNLFGSNIYDRWEKISPAVGEQFEPHPYSTGTTPPGLSKGGLCGSQQQWQEGALTTDPIPAFQPNSVSPICCSPVPFWGVGGTRDGLKFPLVCPFLNGPLPAIMFCYFVSNKPAPCNDLSLKTIPCYNDGFSAPPITGSTLIYQSSVFLYESSRVFLAIYCNGGFSPYQLNIVMYRAFNVQILMNTFAAQTSGSAIQWTWLWKGTSFVDSIYPICAPGFYNLTVNP